MKIICNDINLKPALDEISKFFNTDFSGVILNITAEKTSRTGYTIFKNQTGCIIKYSEKKGFFAALLELIINKDSTGFSCTRENIIEKIGVMLDCSGNAVPTVDTLKNYVLILALLGYSYIELYLEDCFEVKGNEYLGYMRGRYTSEEIKALDNYCSLFDIELIPCIQTLAGYDTFFFKNVAENIDIYEYEGVLAVGSERTYTFLENIISCVRDSFSCDKINICLNDGMYIGMGEHLKYNDYQPRYKLLLNHIKKLYAICKKYNFIPSMWTDTLISLLEERGNGLTVTDITGLLRELPSDMIYVCYDNHKTYKAFNPKIINDNKKYFKNLKLSVPIYKNLGFVPLNYMTEYSVIPALKCACENNINDVTVTVWNGDGGEGSHFAGILSLIDISDAFHKRSLSKKDKDTLCNALTGFSRSNLQLLDMPNLLSDFKLDYCVNPSKTLLFEDVLTGSNFYTASYQYENFYEDLRIKIKPLTEQSKKFKYIFKTIYCLCNVLKAKCALTLDLIDMYEAKDFAGLKSLKESKMPKLIKDIQKLYLAARNQWFAENKSFGWEVITMRLGGLQVRLETISAIINDLLTGKIAIIEPLEERRQDKTERQSCQDVCVDRAMELITYAQYYLPV